MSTIINQATLEGTLKEFILTPLKQPELLPTLLPLIVGAIVIEMYFGKYPDEELGWNTSVGNAIIWMTTGITLIMTTQMAPAEEMAAYGLIGVGAVIGYLDFYHKWPDTVAFVISSSGIVYTLAYIAVVLIKTSTPITDITLKASLVFLVAVNVLFKLIQEMEPSRRRGYP